MKKLIQPIVITLVCLLSSCSATINGASVTPIDATKCVSAEVNKEDCTIHFANDDKFEFTTKEINVKVSDIPSDKESDITICNLSQGTKHLLAIVSGDESCPKKLADAGKDNPDGGYLPAETPAGCNVLLSFVIEPRKAKQLTVNSKMAPGMYYYLITTPGAVDAGMIGKLNVQ